ncbi:uncharacterized protein LOC131314858 isoform X2 [Rhododendron vialii]|uniref:uncharacterized protein LOC131314858 isoform X2 n=1 Tax=Rhododendron vialii TaxID=182163 RepID=UPI00265DC3B0|nr:uncharacterized protein LOC131314858 isoform X2 [Rhododendron vialii]
MTKPKINELFMKKSDEITLKLVEKYKGERYFDLGGKLVKINVKDLTLIFEIKSGPIKIHLQGNPRRPISDFLNRVFKKEKEMLVSRMKIFLRKAFTEDFSESEQDIARVLIMLVLATIFVPLSQPKLSWAYCPFIEDLNTSTTYAWSTFITEHLVKELDTKHTNPTTVGGCVLGLLDKEEDKEKRQEEEKSKEGGVDRTISERVEIATGLHNEILSDEVIYKTICQICKDTQEGERKKEKKRKREQDDIDPPSRAKDLMGKDDRTLKTEEGFIYYRGN